MNTEKDGFVSDIERIVKENLAIVSNDQMFTALSMHRVYDDPRPKTLIVESLTGLVGYVASAVDSDWKTYAILHVVSHEIVSLLTPVRGESNQRSEVAQAKLSRGESFPFGRFMDPDEFNIRLRSMFVETSDLQALLDYVSRIDVSQGANMSDDGVSQSTTVKKSLSGAVRANEKAPARVVLAPYRTFSEIDQPASNFLFRMRSDGSVTCALFEADGGAWKSTARLSISAFLSNALPETLVIA